MEIKNLEDAVMLGDNDSAVQEVYAAQCKLLKAWVNEPHDDFETLLRLTEQQAARANRLLDSRSTLGYEVGKLQGTIDTFRRLFEEEEKDKYMESMVSPSDKILNSILHLLYNSKDNIFGVSRKVVENRMGFGGKTLTKMMEVLDDADAVSICGTTQDATYLITEVGCRYVERHIREEQDNE